MIIIKTKKMQDSKKELPTKAGKKWTEDEDNMLLQELDKNMDIDSISKAHNRSVGSISARQETISYNMHLKKTPIDEIVKKTKLGEKQVTDMIAKKETHYNQRKEKKEVKEKEKKEGKPPREKEYRPRERRERKEIKQDVNLINEMKNEINELKNTIGKLVDIMKVENRIVNMD